MRTKSVWFSLLLSIFSCAFILNCTSEDQGPVAGNVSGTSNALTGVVSTSSGTTKAGICVAVFSEDYVPYFKAGYADTAYTNNDGKFTFDTLPVGKRYNLFAWDTIENRSQFLSGIKADTAVTLNALAFQGNISGKIVRDTLFVPDTGLAYITGSPFYSVLDSSNTLMINGLPAGQYCLSAKQIIEPASLQHPTSPESLHLNPDTVICLTVAPKDTIPITIDFYVLKRALLISDTAYKGIARIVSIVNTGSKNNCGEELVDVFFDFVPNSHTTIPEDTAQWINFRSRGGKASRLWVESLGIAVNKDYVCVKVVFTPTNFSFFILDLYKETWSLGVEKCP